MMKLRSIKELQSPKARYKNEPIETTCTGMIMNTIMFIFCLVMIGIAIHFLLEGRDIMLLVLVGITILFMCIVAPIGWYFLCCEQYVEEVD